MVRAVRGGGFLRFEEKVSAGKLQNLCTMMAGGLCSCWCMMNGMVVGCYNR